MSQVDRAPPTGSAPAEPALAEALLRGPVAEDAPGERWAYRGKWAWLISLFILYHVLALLQHTTPAGGLAERFNRGLATVLHSASYMRATSSVQSWAMFAPNPHRTNTFLQVRVVEQDGHEWDLLHDIYGRRDYPYFFYDRMGKINRRLLEQERYQSPYAAWVCRDWALHHGGEAPKRVNFTKLWTRVPHPSKVIPTMGFDPYELKLHREDLPGFDCATTVHAQLPDEIRARHGLPPLPPGTFRDIEENTWYDRAQAKAKIIERRRAADSGKRGGAEGPRERVKEPVEPAESAEPPETSAEASPEPPSVEGAGNEGGAD